MVGKIAKYRALLQQYGARRCFFRLRYDVRRKCGLLKRRFPVWAWNERPLSWWLRPGVPTDPQEYRDFREHQDTHFFFPLGEAPRPPAEWVRGAVGEIAALRAGRFRYFFRREAELGFPEPDWLLNPFTGQRDSVDRHWCDRDDFEADRGDIKYIWEPARFAWAYALARAYAADPRDEYAETFWQLFESWLAANPPMMGPNWMCGQEISIRGMACVFAASVFWNSPATTADRVAMLVRLLAASAERIAGNIAAACNQMGNHGVGEAAGLWTIGLLFPELRGADEWLRLGQKVLDNEARLYNFPDGGYIQHSVNYQRFVLHDYVWCMRLAELNGTSFAELTSDRLARSYEFLHQLQDEATGRVPNYGPNDGALIVPINGCDYLDYRPVLGATHYLYKRERLYGDGPWSEDLLWLFGEDSLRSPMRPVARVNRDFPDGGYYTIRGNRSWGMVRCHTYRNRPNQADMLHLDLWWQGINLLRDSGSFSYNDAREHWDRYFPSTAAHNTVVVANTDQMIKGPRFQWFSLLKTRLLGRQSNHRVDLWAGEHYGYQRLPCQATHRRSICRLGEECWLIVDDVLGTGEETVDLYWHLPDAEHALRGDELTLHLPKGTCCLHLLSQAAGCERRVLRGVDEDGVRGGWESLYYGERREALTARVSARTTLPARLVTLIGLGASVRVLQADLDSIIRWDVDGGPSWAARLLPPGQEIGAIASLERDGHTCELRS